MKTIYNQIGFCLGLTLLLSSCQHYYYMPNVQNAPVLKEAKELHVSASLMTGEYISGAEGQISYAVAPNVGAMGAVQYGSASEGHGNYFDLGMGYFKPLGKVILFEVYAGMGQCNQKHSYRNTGPSTNFAPGATEGNLQFNKMFIQPAIALSTNGFDLILSCRLAQLKFTRCIITSQDGKERQIEQWDGIKLDEPVYLIEPAITLRGGWKYFKMQSQLLISTETQTYHPFERFNLNVGVYFSFAKRYHDKSTDRNLEK